MLRHLTFALGNTDPKMAVGHFYSLNLRTHTLRHLAAGEGLREHDMSALSRIKPTDFAIALTAPFPA
jgi:hypothetical protein